MKVEARSVTSLVAVKRIGDAFVADRDWTKFHQPRNLVLALAGECGEVCEIFQWKGGLDDGVSAATFSADEIDHIGEELADVLIYSTRLCSICKIDLAGSVRCILKCSEASCHPAVDWEAYSFEDMRADTLSSALYTTHFSSKSPRDCALSIQKHMGNIADLFLAKTESSCSLGLVGWDVVEVSELSRCVAHLCVQVSCLSALIGRSLSVCVADKFTKNAKKYPVELVRGSSAKYTAYAEKLKPILFSSRFVLAACLLSGALGVLLGSGVPRSAWSVLRGLR